MTEDQINVHKLDAAYKPFPSFEEWASKTSVDTVRWNRYKAALESRPQDSGVAFQRAREIVKRATALDTGAIEGLYEVDRGFTFSVAMETTAWEIELARRGEHVRPLFEAQLHAYDYVLDLATKAEQISEAAIRKLHEVVCAAQDTYRVVTAIGFQEQRLPKGRYKVLPNHVMHTRVGTTHSYAPVDVTPVEMARLLHEMRTDAFQAAHPVMQAAYAHYGLVAVHPFADGNGRVARALASVFTYRAISMPIMILSEHKEAYLDALEASDELQYQKFVSFMLVRSLDTMNLIEESLRGAYSPSADESAAAIKSLYVTRGGYTQAQVDDAANQLQQLIISEATKIIDANSNSNFQGNVGMSGLQRDDKIYPDAAYRLQARRDYDLSLMHFDFYSSPPAQARVSRDYVLWLPRDAASDDDLLLVLVRRGVNSRTSYTKEKSFSARADELIPKPAVVLQVRVEIFVDRVIGEMLAELKKETEAILKGSIQIS